MGETRRSKTARYEKNGEEARSNEKRSRNAWKGGTVLDICRGVPLSHKFGVWMRVLWRFWRS